MPRLLALEWDAREARVAVARTRGRDVVIEHAFAIDLGPRDAGQTFADVSVGQQIAAGLAARSVGRCETLVAVGRASIELRRLSLPPAPADELPELVRFQALRQFTGIGEDWLLDFVPLETSETDSLNVLAAAISPEIVEQIRGTCQAGQLTPRRLVLRPFAAASLLRRRDGGGVQPCRLMVDLLADEADLTVLVDQQVALVRTVRLAAQDAPGAVSRALVGEIRRTVAAAHNQLRDRRIERVVLCGAGEEQETLKSLVEQELGQEVETFAPFEGLPLARELKDSQPENSGRFAPLLGMLLDEALGPAHAIDFLHPRQKSKPPSTLRRNIFIAATAASVVLAIVFFLWSRLSSLDADIDALTQKSNGMKKNVAAAEKKRAEAASIGEFLESDIAWLDELHRLARALPSSEKVILTQVTLSTRLPKGGQIVLDGYARESNQVSELGQSLRGTGRQVISTGSQYDERRDTYRWRFKETVLVEPRSENGAADSKPPAAGETTTAAKNTKRTPR